MSDVESAFINMLVGIMLAKNYVPTKYHDQVKAVKTLMKNDVSGLVDTLTDFSVNTADVNFSIVSENKELEKTLNKWLERINVAYNGRIPSGINSVAKEYYKERWKYSSFPVLKVLKWGRIDGLELPVKMAILDGGSIYSDKDEKSDQMTLLDYDYYIGKGKEQSNKLGDNCIFTQTSGRWFDEYPTPYIIKRGIYRNWLLIKELKNHESKVLKMIIPYMLNIKKGGHFGDIVKKYSQKDLNDVTDDVKSLIKDIKEDYRKLGVRTTNFDEEIKHLIPDISPMFDPNLFAMSERNILSGMGFVDVLEGTTSNRRESILNPKAFVEEVKTGVKDFKHTLKDLMFKIEAKNIDAHPKYFNKRIKIISNPVRGFMTDEFKTEIRQLYDRGRISSQTAVELIAETDFETEVLRREREDKDMDIQSKMYPVITRNQEAKQYVQDNPGDKDEDTLNRKIPDDKKDPNEKEEYDIGEEKLTGAPYETIKALPENIKQSMSTSLQRLWLRTFNEVYEETNSEEKAMKAAWSNVKKKGRKSKTDKDKWVRK